jgi:predicted enzyme related to lactoylglutathione lyase
MRASDLMVIHYVYDMKRAIAFYRDALELPIITESPGWSMLSCGDAIVALHMMGPDVPEGPLQHAGLCLKVDVLEAAITDICNAGGRQRAEIREADAPRVPVRVVEMQDCEGNAFELRQYVQ